MFSVITTLNGAWHQFLQVFKNFKFLIILRCTIVLQPNGLACADFRYFVLWSIGHPIAWVTGFENSESCISPFYKGWGTLQPNTYHFLA